MHALTTKKVLVFLLGLIVLGLGIAGIRYLGLDRSLPEAGVSVLVDERGESSEESAPSNSLAPAEYVVDRVASGLFVPWSIVFTSPERILVTERSGKVRVIENKKLIEKPLYQFSVHTGGEEGLMGMALDPDYPQNKFVYFSYAVGTTEAMRIKVVRLTDRGDALGDETVLVENIPAATYHAGSRIAFGPDGKLYVSTGDATEKNLAQDKDSLAGKILRMNRDGSIPNDNPFDSLVWSLGHRNPQGLAWHKETGALFSTEHGPSVFDGPAGGDEINQIEKGRNYGWPIVSHEKSDPRFIDPLLVFTPAVAPAGALVYSGRAFPQFENNLFFGGLKGEGLFRATLSPTAPHRVLSYEKMIGGAIGRVREVMEGPDGFIYFTTSNRDGRGSVKPGDDQLYRLMPAK